MSDHKSILLEVEALCGELVEEVIDEPKLRRLEQLVLENFEAKRIYVKYINLYAALGHHTAGKTSSGASLFDISEDKAPLPLPLPEATTPLLGLPSLTTLWMPLASVLVVLGLVGTWILGDWKSHNNAETAQATKVQTPEAVDTTIPGGKKQASEYVAELTWLGATSGDGGEVSSSKNSLLAKGGVLRIQDEDVYVQFACGAEVTLHGPAVFHIVSEKLARLEYGTLEAKVPPQAIGFLIDTPASRVIDLGTEFAVTVADNGDTNINVLNGEVEAEPTRPWLIGGELRRKLFEGDSLKLSPPVTESFRVDFNTPDSLDVFDIVRPDPTSCLLDPAAGLLTLKTQSGTICKDKNNNSNIVVVPIPDCDFEAVLKVKRFEPSQPANHVSLAILDGQDNVYRVSYWVDQGKRAFVCTKEEEARHGYVENTKGIHNHFCDMQDRPFRLRVVREEDAIATYWGKESGPWIPSGKMSSKFKPRFIGFFATNPKLWQGQNEEFIDCVIDSFELRFVTPEP